MSDITQAAKLALTALEVLKDFNKLPPSDVGFAETAIQGLRSALNPKEKKHKSSDEEESESTP